MQILTGLTNAPAQTSAIPLDDGGTAQLSLRHSAGQQCWFYDLAHQPANFLLTGVRLVTSPNILRQYKNLLPFGLMCAIPAGGEPMTQDCLADGTATLVLLDAADVQTVERQFYTK
jgi:hypothetical protein